MKHENLISRRPLINSANSDLNSRRLIAKGLRSIKQKVEINETAKIARLRLNSVINVYGLFFGNSQEANEK